MGFPVHLPSRAVGRRKLKSARLSRASRARAEETSSEPAEVARGSLKLRGLSHWFGTPTCSRVRDHSTAPARRRLRAAPSSMLIGQTPTVGACLRPATNPLASTAATALRHRHFGHVSRVAVVYRFAQSAWSRTRSCNEARVLSRANCIAPRLRRWCPRGSVAFRLSLAKLRMRNVRSATLSGEQRALPDKK